MADQTLDESTLTIGSTSPFLPGTNIQFAWDSTSLGLIKNMPSTIPTNHDRRMGAQGRIGPSPIRYRVS
jgi:hypothetical protein